MKLYFQVRMIYVNYMIFLDKMYIMMIYFVYDMISDFVLYTFENYMNGLYLIDLACMLITCVASNYIHDPINLP
jgi:hypothetical protein